MDVSMSTITRRMSSVLDGLQNEFRTICTINDVEAKMYAVKAAGSSRTGPVSFGNCLICLMLVESLMSEDKRTYIMKI